MRLFSRLSGNRKRQSSALAEPLALEHRPAGRNALYPAHHTEPSPALAARRQARRSCVIVVENLPVPFDRRVWQEATALRRAGWQVSVICPATEHYPARFEEIDGICIYRHRLPLEARGRAAFLLEYVTALLHEFRLLVKVWRERGFTVIQACNPPDLIFLVAWPFKLLGKRFLFDHHDVSPELFTAKFDRKGMLHRLLLMFEKMTFRAADMVVSANDTFRDIAIDRGGKHPKDVVTVYSVPDRARIRRVRPAISIRNGRRFVLGYLGIVNNQDGVDHMVRAVEHLVRRDGFTDFQAVIVGDGPALPAVQALTSSLGLDDHITLTGYLSGEALLQHISAFDVGMIPDPVNDYNDKISMNKVFEYSALGIPSVAYPLTETRRLLGGAGLYAASPDPSGLAAACLRLFHDDALREKCANAAARLGREAFDWDAEARKYVAAFERLVA
jgi:glycosyltransferase involved in cell wall biosynthesis